MRAAALDDPVRIRRADRELLSLALIDARNRTLRWLEVFESRQLDGSSAAGPAPRWLAGHAGWYQEFWIARHLQRARGEHCDAAAPRLPSVQPRADPWFGATSGQPPDAAAVRAYLAETMETTLELLAGAADDGDDTLHFFRAALLHEDRIGERLAEIAAALQIPRRSEPAPPVQPLPARVQRDALWMPSQRFALGSAPGGLVPDNERWADELMVPEFEIDAQAVNWQRYVEFAEEGGYDRAEFWTDTGWAWLQHSARRAPRDVEQMRGGVLVQRDGQLQRAPAGQAVLHVTRHEAEAWCRWAKRRLPTEPEWELAALVARSRGFVWGDVFEWVAGSARPWPGFGQTPGSLDRMPAARAQAVLRGASWITPARWHHPKARRFAPAQADAMFCGFRSCAV